MILLIDFLSYVVGLYQIVLVIMVILSWIFSAGLISRYDQRIRPVVQVVDALTEPFLRRIRPWMPDTRPLDLAPLVLFLICFFINGVVLGNAKCLAVVGELCR